MNKKIISLLLAILMIIPLVFTGCGKITDEEAQKQVDEEASASTITLSMYVVSEKEVSPETQKLVNDEFNRITKSTFKSRVVLHFATYDKYYEMIEGVFEANVRDEEIAEEHEKVLDEAMQVAAAYGDEINDAWYDAFYEAYPQYAKYRITEELTGDDTTAEETVLVTVEGAEDFVMSETKYPEEDEHQIDIIWIDSFDRYKDYIDRGLIERLDDELTGSSKKIKEYVNGDLLKWAKWAGSGTYAIPNNSVIGEYTYLLLNKKLVDKYNYDPSALNTVVKCEQYINDIARYETGVQPIYGEVPIANTFYWSYDSVGRKIITDRFSLLANSYSNEKTLDTGSTSNSFIGAKNLFTVNDYLTQLRLIQKFKDQGYISDTLKDGQEYALRIVKGDASLAKQYSEDYYMNILETPRLTEDSVFSSMFAVSSYTKKVTRSMEIVTYLSTNAELRNILQYGVENVHYTRNIDGTVHRLNSDYMMDIRKTGNELIAYPLEGMDPEVWTYCKNQNRNVKSGLLNTFRVKDEDLEKEPDSEEKPLNVAELETLNQKSEEIYKKLQAVKNSEELEALIAEVLADTSIVSLTKNQSSQLNTSAIYGVYAKWMQDTSLYVPEE